MPHRRRLLLATAAVYGIALALIGLWPTHVDNGLQMQDHTWYGAVEFAANVVLFVPLGALGMLVSPRMRWAWVVGAGLLLSSAVEILQAVARPDRTADAGDVAANVIGAAAGALLVVLWRIRTARRRQRAGS